MALLRDIPAGQTVVVRQVSGRSSFRRRIIEMGFIRGREIYVLKNAPFKDPIEYRIMDYHISLRRSEAALIEVVPVEEAGNLKEEYYGTLSFDKKVVKNLKPIREINVAFVGNPNAGKTSIFNSISGRHEHVGNYSGVTVDAKKARIHYKDYLINLVDLPGTYSLSPNSPDELFVRDHLLHKFPDVVINVLDSSNLERNLLLTTQLIDMDIPVVVAFNMKDELDRQGDELDIEQFSKISGMPGVWTVGTKKHGCGKLLKKAVEVAENNDPVQRHIHINYGTELELSINNIQKSIWKSGNYIREYSSRYLALRLLEQDAHTLKKVEHLDNFDEIIAVSNNEIKRLDTLFKENTQTLITQARYGFINGALKETLKKGAAEKRKTISQKVDQLLTGRLTGFPIFLLVLWIMFQTTFKLGAFPADWIDMGVSWLGAFVGSVIPTGPARDLVIDGIFGGVGGVLVFLPNIVILFFFISLMEDTGYMSRVAFIMDKLMHLIGLHGKSFIPLIMGFGCNVPAIMSTRSLENRSDRLLTILIIPFMTCSARLPVYILIAGAIFPDNAGTVIFSMYLGGILISILTAILLKKTIFRAKEAPFVMELPPYRIPTLRSTTRHMWSKAREYLKKMGGVILWASIIIWFLSYFPRNNNAVEHYRVQAVQLEKILENSTDPVLTDSLNVELDHTQIMINHEQQYNSYLGKMGRGIEPLIRPIGFDWKIGVSLLSGIIAKEIVISTLGVLYAEDDQLNLRESIQNQTYRSGDKIGQKIYTEATTLALLVFVLIYVPCIAVIAAIRKESGKWKWALFNVGYATTLAWILAFIVSKVAAFFF